MLFPVAKLLEGREAPLCVHADTSLRKVLELMIEHDYSQIPVIDAAGNIAGIVSEQTIIRKYYHLDGYADYLSLPAGHAQMRSVTMQPDGDVFDVLDQLKSVAAVVVVDGKKPIGIITDYDTTLFFRNISEGLILVQDIEISLRQYIEAIFADESDRTKALISVFGEKKGGLNEPNKAYERFTFGDTTRFIAHDSVWPQFQSIFEPKEVFNKQLDAARIIRNQLMHFRDNLSPVQHHMLLDTLQWLNTRPSLRLPHASKIETVELRAEDVQPNTNRGKYESLQVWLEKQRLYEKSLQLTFSQIEKIIGSSLPLSAQEHRSWWANEASNHTHTRSWLRAGWRIESVDLEAKNVVFKHDTLVLIQEFFQETLDRFKELRPDATRASRTQARSGFMFTAGKSGISYCWAFSYTTLRVELYIDTEDKATNKHFFDILIQYKEYIEQQVGHQLNWQRLDKARTSRIIWERPAKITDSVEALELYKEWIVQTTLKFADVFKPLFVELVPLSEPQSEDN